MHPVIVYEMALDVVIGVVAYFLIGKLRPNGSVFYLYLLMYGLGTVRHTVHAGGCRLVPWSPASAFAVAVAGRHRAWIPGNASTVDRVCR